MSRNGFCILISICSLHYLFSWPCCVEAELHLWTEARVRMFYCPVSLLCCTQHIYLLTVRQIKRQRCAIVFTLFSYMLTTTCSPFTILLTITPYQANLRFTNSLSPSEKHTLSCFYLGGSGRLAHNTYDNEYIVLHSKSVVI